MEGGSSDGEKKPPEGGGSGGEPKTKRKMKSASQLEALERTYQGSGVESMEREVKRWCTSRRWLERCSADRLTSLPDEVLSKILSLLSTKDAVAMQLLSKKMNRDVLALVTSLDFDDSIISYCVKRPHLVDRVPLFEEFVDNTLRRFFRRYPLTRFSLHVGGDKTNYIEKFDSSLHTCRGQCLPFPEPCRLNARITFPFIHPGLRELDIFFHVTEIETCEFHIPPQLFTCQSLEVLKLDSNLELNGDKFSIVSFPNLKLLHFRSLTIVDDDFINRLISNCPSIEDLAITRCCWKEAYHLAVSSHSLRRLELVIERWLADTNPALVVFDTPNLQYFNYDDALAYRYSVTYMNALVQARFRASSPLGDSSFGCSVEA
ncbi:hypothetical protein RND81_14G027400 [Saponaria officinalis]|uniref:F-box domain-containing protein n=1 Tax=Saponaria officinalis TaxID=3572 RepID=A0AAW1GHJ3_SAPOF